MSRPAPVPPEADLRFAGRLYCVAPCSDLSGAPRSSLGHARLLREHVDAVCLVLPARGPIEALAHAADVPVWVRPIENRGLRSSLFRRSLFRDLGAVVGSRWRYFRDLCREFRREPGLVHVHSSASVAPLALAAARRCGLPAVLHVREPADSRARRAAVRALAGLARAVIFVSDGVRRGYGRGWERRSVVIHNPMPAAPAGASPASSSDRSVPRIVMPALMGRRKGYDLFLEIIRRLREAGVDCEAWMVGGWTSETDRARAVDFTRRHGLESVVTIREAISDMDPVYAQSDLLLLPARRDPLPRVVMEAMGHGLPVVASRVDGIPEMVEDGVTGCLAEPEDVDGFVRHARRLLEDPDLRARMGAAGRARARRLFAPETYVHAMLRVYAGLSPARQGGRTA